MQQASAVHRVNTRLGTNHSGILSRDRAKLTAVTGGWAPQNTRGGDIGRCGFIVLSVAALLCAPATRVPALAGTRQGATGATGTASPESSSSSSAPSHFLAFSLLGSAIRAEGEWDSGFGGGITVGALRDCCALGAWAAAVGFLAFSERSGGRASAEVAVGTRWPTGVLVGLSGGPLLELDELRKPRAGGQISLWVFAGVVPYVRVGTVEKSGLFVDIGVGIHLPAGRW